VARSRCPQAISIVAAGAVLLSGCDLPTFGAPDSASTQGDHVLSLWRLFFVIAMGVGLLVWGLLLFVLVRYRRRSDEVPSQQADNLRVEVLYVALPIAIVIGLFAASVNAEAKITELRPRPDVRIEVVGFQWQWQFSYRGTDAVVSTDGDDLPELVLPIGQRVRFHLTTADVVHSFWVPDFLEKRDLIPGVDNEIDVTPTELGTFDGRCAEYCGLDHWRMSFTVRVVTPDEFESWLDDQERP
jgi:cytochrome c oxidase subunit 2